MAGVHGIADAAVIRIALPYRRGDFIEQPLSPAAMNRRAGPGHPADDLLQSLAHRQRRACTGLLDVDGPRLIEGVGEVDLNAGELGCLALGDQAEPVAPGHEASVAVDVGAL